MLRLKRQLLLFTFNDCILSFSDMPDIDIHDVIKISQKECRKKTCILFKINIPESMIHVRVKKFVQNLFGHLACTYLKRIAYKLLSSTFVFDENINTNRKSISTKIVTSPQCT